MSTPCSSLTTPRLTISFLSVYYLNTQLYWFRRIRFCTYPTHRHDQRPTINRSSWQHSDWTPSSSASATYHWTARFLLTLFWATTKSHQRRLRASSPPTLAPIPCLSPASWRVADTLPGSEDPPETRSHRLTCTTWLCTPRAAGGRQVPSRQISPRLCLQPGTDKRY